MAKTLSDYLNDVRSGGVTEEAQDAYFNDLESRPTTPVVEQPADQSQSFLGDVGKQLKAGAVQLGAGAYNLADLATFGGLDVATKTLTGTPGSEYLSETIDDIRSEYSPEAQAALQNVSQAEGVGGTLSALAQNPRALGSYFFESLPSVVPGLGAAGLAAKAAARAGAAKNLSAPAIQALRTKRAIQANIGTSAALGGGFGGMQARERIMKMPPEELEALPAYQEALAETDNPIEARRQLALRAGQAALLPSAAISGLAGAISAPFEAALVTRAPGATSRIASGLLRETGEEAVQEGGETASANLGVGLIDPSVPLFEGVPEAATIGALLGGMTGGALSGIDVALNRGGTQAVAENDKDARDEIEDATKKGPDQVLALPSPDAMVLRHTGGTVIFPDGSSTTDPTVVRQYVARQIANVPEPDREETARLTYARLMRPEKRPGAFEVPIVAGEKQSERASFEKMGGKQRPAPRLLETLDAAKDEDRDGSGTPVQRESDQRGEPAGEGGRPSGGEPAPAEAQADDREGERIRPGGDEGLARPVGVDEGLDGDERGGDIEPPVQEPRSIAEKFAANKVGKRDVGERAADAGESGQAESAAGVPPDVDGERLRIQRERLAKSIATLESKENLTPNQQRALKGNRTKLAKIEQALEGAPDAEEVRSDAGQVQERGLVGQERQKESGEDLQQPEKAESKTSYTEDEVKKLFRSPKGEAVKLQGGKKTVAKIYELPREEGGEIRHRVVREDGSTEVITGGLDKARDTVYAQTGEPVRQEGDIGTAKGGEFKNAAAAERKLNGLRKKEPEAFKDAYVQRILTPQPNGEFVSSFVVRQPEIVKKVRAPTKRAPSPIDVKKDNIATAIAKLGGLSREEAQAQGIDPAAFKQAGVRIGGKISTALPKEGGRSFDDIAEGLSQYGFFSPEELKSPNLGSVLLDKLKRQLEGEDILTPAGMEAALAREAEERAKIEEQLAPDEEDPFAKASAGEDFLGMTRADLEDEPDFALEGETEEEIKAREAEEKAAAQAEAKKAKAAEEKAKADIQAKAPLVLGETDQPEIFDESVLPPKKAEPKKPEVTPKLPKNNQEKEEFLRDVIKAMEGEKFDTLNPGMYGNSPETIAAVEAEAAKRLVGIGPEDFGALRKALREATRAQREAKDAAVNERARKERQKQSAERTARENVGLRAGDMSEAYKAFPMSKKGQEVAQKIVDGWRQRFGFPPIKLDFYDHPSINGKFQARVVDGKIQDHMILLSPDLLAALGGFQGEGYQVKRALAMETLGHEFGHALEKEYFQNATPEIQRAVKKEYLDWQRKFREKPVDAMQDRKPRIGSAQIFATIKVARERGNQLNKPPDYYMLSFDEWIADHISRYLSQGNVEGVKDPKVASFIKRLANQVRRLWRFMNEEAAGKPAQSVVEFAESIRAAVARKGEVQFSRKPATQKRQSNIVDISRAIRKLSPRANRELIQSGLVKIVQSESELPKDLQHKEGGVHGAYDSAGRGGKGQVYLVADNIRPENVRGLILHEVGVHHGMKGLLGPKLFKQVMMTVKKKVEAGEEQFVLARNLVPKDTEPRHVLEETVAYLLQHWPEISFSKRILAAVRNTLRRIGLVKDVTTEDLIQVAQAAVRRASSLGRPVITREGMYHRVFHGSPYDFDKFSLDKIGGGEGIQAYGWGMYFADSKGVAEHYKDILGKGGGKLYETELSPEKNEYLDWDRTIEDQGDKIKAALPKHRFQDWAQFDGTINYQGEPVKWDEAVRRAFPEKEGNDLIAAVRIAEKTSSKLGFAMIVDERVIPMIRDKLGLGPQQWRSIRMPSISNTGMDIYTELSNELGGDQEASLYLKSLGIPGIKYFDQMSRGGETDTYNYVVFDENAIEITAKYSRQDPNLPDPVALKEAFAKMGEQKRPFLGRVMDYAKAGKEVWGKDWDNLKNVTQQGMFDRFYGIKNAYEKAGKTQLTEQMGYVSARMSTGLSSVMQAILLRGAPKWENGQIIGKKEGSEALLEILDDVKGEVDDFLRWMVGERAANLAEKKKEKLFEKRHYEALQKLKNVNDREARFKATRDKYNAFKKDVLDLAQEAGIINPETRVLWDRTDYIPFYRVKEGDVHGPGQKPGLSGQYGVTRLFGRKQNLNDPLENIIMNFSHLIDASMKNMALKQTITDLADTGMFTNVTAKERFKPALVPMSQVKSALKNAGMEEDKIPSGVLEGMRKLWQYAPPTDDNVVRVMIGGKAKYYHVTDPLLLRALTGVNSSPLGGIIKPMRWFKKLLTGAVTADPAFMARNLLRDAVHAWVVTDESFKPGVGTVKGIIHSIRKDGGFEDMLFAGSSFMGGYVHANDPGELATAIRRSLRAKGLSTGEINKFMGTVITSPKFFWDKYRQFGDAIENSNREAVYEAIMKAGKAKEMALRKAGKIKEAEEQALKTKIEALFQAKDLMDYSMRGDWKLIQIAADVLPFFNARMQGLYKLGRAGAVPLPGLIDKRIALRGAVVTAFAMVLLAKNRDDERWKELEEWDKDQYFHLFFGEEVKKILGFDHIRLPKPFEVGVIYGTIPERIAMRLLGDEETKDTMERLLWAAKETFAINAVPQAVRPLVDIYSNVDSFTKRPIESLSDEGRLSSARYNSQTSDLMREMGQYVSDVTGISPKQLEHLWQGYTGALGGYALGLTDIAMRKMMGMPEIPERRIDEWPVAKSFFRADPAKSTKYRTEFYELYTEAEELFRTINWLNKPGRNADKAKELLIENRDKLAARRLLVKTRDRLNQIRDQMDTVYRSTRLTPEEKRVKIDRMIQNRNDLAKRAVERAKGAF